MDSPPGLSKNKQIKTNAAHFPQGRERACRSSQNLLPGGLMEVFLCTRLLWGDAIKTLLCPVHRHTNKGQEEGGIRKKCHK